MQPIAPNDEDFWTGISRRYSTSSDFVNLENGYFGVQADPVFDAFQRYNQQINQEGAYFQRVRFPLGLIAANTALAEFGGVGADELLLTRNATEGLNLLISGYSFNPGDEIIYGDQDYRTVIAALKMAQGRKGLQLTMLDLPLDPQSDEDIVDLYRRAISAKTRVLIVSHMIYLSGQILPVAKIAAMARACGVDVFVDAAHSFAQLDYRLPDLGCDFVVVNLHKWLGAPLTVGMLYIRRQRIPDIAPLYGDDGHAATDIEKLGNFGTLQSAAIMAIPDALTFHQTIGGKNKEARLRYLKEYWLNQVRELPRINILSPAAPERSCAIAAFRMNGTDAQTVADYLFERHRIYTVVIEVKGESAVRVIPHLHNTIAQLDCLVRALADF